MVKKDTNNNNDKHNKPHGRVGEELLNNLIMIILWDRRNDSETAQEKSNTSKNKEINPKVVTIRKH